MKNKLWFLSLTILLMALRGQAQNVGYVVDNSGGQVDVVDLSARRTTATIRTGQGASEILILPNNWLAFVANQTDNTVSAINLSNNTLVATIATGQGPNSLVASPDGRILYVADIGSNDVTVIDTVGLAVTTTIPVDVSPVQVNISPSGQFLYVVNQDAGDVSVIDTDRNQIVGTLAVGLKPAQFAISPNQTAAYVVNSGSNNVTVVNLSTNQVTGTIGVGQGPSSVAFSTDGSILYVINQGGNSISVVNTQQNRVTAQIAVGSQPAAMAITFDSKFGYVSNQSSNSVSVLDLTANANESTISVGSGPFDLHLDPNENFLYVTNLNSGSLTVIDVNLDQVVAPVPNTIPLGGQPVQFLQLNAPTLLELAPNPIAAGGRLTLSGEGFLASSIVQITTSAPPRTTPAQSTFLDSQGLQLTLPSFQGNTATVTVANPDGDSSEQLTLRIGSPGPAIFSGGVVEGAGFQPAPYPVSGNAIVSVFGSFSGMTADQAQSLPLPTTLGNIRLTFNGVPVPLIATVPAAGQINAIAPIRLLAQSSVRVAVTAQGQTGPVEIVNVAPTSPGIFMFSPDGVGAFVHGLRPLSPVSAADPAQRGEVITMYSTGLGNTTPSPLDGQSAPGDVLSNTTAQPAVTVAGASANVSFSGLAPSFSGLYQINFIVPQSAPSANDVSVSVSTGDRTSNTVKLAVR